jgi:hypothetical protein
MWAAAWSTKSIIRDMGQGVYSRISWSGARAALVDEGNTSHGLLHAHYGKALAALSGLKDRKDRVLSVNFNPIGLRYEDEP